jgi:hypothetical protein
MNLDRIVLDFLVWIKEQFWKAPSRSPVYLYEEIARFDSSRGYLKLVRRNTPRAVATWVFIPKRNTDLDKIKHPSPPNQVNEYKHDIYICCDHLFAVAESAKSNRKIPSTRLNQKQNGYAKKIKTHKISVLQISHFLQKDDTFESFELFSQEYDLIRQGSRDIHREAMAVVQSVAMLLKYRAVDDWHFEIESYRKQFLGSSYTPTIKDINYSLQVETQLQFEDKKTSSQDLLANKNVKTRQKLG